jgi:hypothetical protein
MKVEKHIAGKAVERGRRPPAAALRRRPVINTLQRIGKNQPTTEKPSKMNLRE